MPLSCSYISPAYLECLLTLLAKIFIYLSFSFSWSLHLSRTDLEVAEVVPPTAFAVTFLSFPVIVISQSESCSFAEK